MIAQEQVKGWEYLYDKYSSSMYGIIYTLLKNKNIAEDIFVNLFLHLKENMDILITQNEKLCTFLMQETLAFVRNDLKIKGLGVDTNSLSETPKLIQLLCAKYCLLQDEVINGDAEKIIV